MALFYEFFAGGGMARAGLGQGWRCAFANDFDQNKAASYAANWGTKGLHISDVADLKTSDLPGTADLAWASFPCQDLSLAGAGAGLQGERSGSFWPFWNLMRRLQEDGRARLLPAGVGLRRKGTQDIGGRGAAWGGKTMKTARGPFVLSNILESGRRWKPCRA